jgi:hypothetical protein
MSVARCRIVIGREGELLRKIAPLRTSLNFGPGTRVDGEFEIQPIEEDYWPIIDWLGNAMSRQDRLRLMIEFVPIERYDGECYIVETNTRPTSAIIGFKIVGTLEAPK